MSYLSHQALGSYVTNLAKGDLNVLRSISEVPTIFLSILYLLCVWAVAKDFEYLVANDRVVGGSKQPKVGPLHSYLHLPARNGLRPGDVGYDGYTNIQAGMPDDSGLEMGLGHKTRNVNTFGSSSSSDGGSGSSSSSSSSSSSVRNSEGLGSAVDSEEWRDFATSAGTEAPMTGGAGSRKLLEDP